MLEEIFLTKEERRKAMQIQIANFFKRKVDRYDAQKYVIAVSGGVDSMVLLHAMALLFGENAKNQIIVSHVNYGLRKESKSEEKLVKDFCQKYQIPVETKQWQQKQGEHPSENKLREFRYGFFDEVLKKYQAHYLVLAHHQDDQLETILMKWSRGSTLEGLSGMKEKRIINDVTILRPFLSFSKEALYAEAKKQKVPYLEDSSNQTNEYTRNRYRHQFIPFLKKENVYVGSHFQKSAQMIADAYACLAPILEEKLSRLVRIENHAYVFQSQAFLEEPVEMQRLLLQQLLIQMDTDISVAQMEQILEKIESPKPQLTIDLSNGWKFKKRYDQCSFDQMGQIEIEDVVYTISTPEETLLRPSEEEEILITEGKTAFEFSFPVCASEFPLVIRHIRSGDRIALNAEGTKHQKIARWCINSKIPKEERERLWVLENSSQEIRAILGYRYVEPLSFTQETGKMMLSYENKTRCKHVKK